MEITKTTVTRTATHRAGEINFNIEYSTTDERLDRIDLNIFRLPVDNEAENFIGTVHYDGHNISCNLPMEDDLADLFERSVGFIAEIIESVGQSTGEETSGNHNQR